MPYIGEKAMLTQQVVQGDCKAVLRTLAGESVDFVPYFVRYKDRSGRSIANDDHSESVLGAFNPKLGYDRVGH